MNFLLATLELVLLCAVIVYDVSLGYGHKVDMSLSIFLLSAFLKIPEWLIGAGFITTVFRIKYIRAMRRMPKPKAMRDPGAFGLRTQWIAAFVAVFFGVNLFGWMHYNQFLVDPFTSILGLVACPFFWLMGMVTKYHNRSKAK